ncbi:MAG: molybdopterin-dependent oxidoreductase, partial [Desulfobacterales bacterium]
LQLRLKNYRGPGEIDQVLNQEIGSNGLAECLEKGAVSSDWQKKRHQKTIKGALKRGIGLSTMMHGTGAGKALPDPAAAAVMINADGSVNLVTAAADEGQGNGTVLAQIASETLGIDFDKISVSETDTDITPLDCGTHGSRQAYGGGLAVRAVATEARKKLLTYVKKELGVMEDQLRIKDATTFEAKNPDNNILISNLMRKTQIHTKVILKGERPPCLKSQQQCRGCFGWRNMLKAAQTDNFWQSYPFRCSLTGLTLKVKGKTPNVECL